MFCLKLHLRYLAAKVLGRYLHGSIVAGVLLLDPDRSHAVPVALPYSRLLGHYLRPVLPIKNQDFRNSLDLKFLQDFMIFRIPKFEANFRLKVNLHSIRFSYVFVRFFTFLLLLDKECAFSSAFLCVHIRTNQRVTYWTKVF